MQFIHRLAVASTVAAVAAVTVPAAQAEEMFGPNYTGDTVLVVNTRTNAVIHTIPLSGSPCLSAVTPNGKKVLIVDCDTNQLVPVTVATDTAGTPIQLPGGSSADPEQIAVAPNGHAAYVVEYTTESLVPVDLSTDTAGTPVPIGAEPYGVSLTPNGQTAYASSYEDGTIEPINLVTGSPGAPIMVTGASWIATTPNGHTLYVLDYADRQLVPVSTATGTPGTPIVLASSEEPWGVVISPNGQTAYVNDYEANVVFPIDLGTGSVGTGVPVGVGSEYPALTPDGGTLYTSNYSGESLSPVHTSTLIAGAPIAVGGEPGQLGIVPDQGPKARFSDKVKGSKVKFNASRSSDSAERIIKYQWNFGDGKKLTTTKAKVTHRYKHKGRHKVTLTEVDKAGCSTQQIYNGQDVYCNGSKAARTTHKVNTKK